MHDALVGIVDDINFAIGLVSIGVHDVEGTVVGVYEEVLHVAEVDLPAWGHWAYNAAMQGVDYVGAELDDLGHLAESEFDQIRHDAASFGDWVYNNVLTPLGRLVESLPGWTGGLIRDAIDGFYNDIIEPIINGAKWLYDHVVSTLQWLENVGYRIADDVLRAEEWLVWFALHPFSWFESALSAFEESVSGDRIISAVEADADYIDRLADQVATWLG